MVKEVERCPGKTAIFAISAIITMTKNCSNVKNCQSCDFSLHTKILQFLLLRANLDISETCGSISSIFIKLDKKVFQGHTIIYL